jgi:DNA-binding response OmpR family regulator
LGIQKRTSISLFLAQVLDDKADMNSARILVVEDDLELADWIFEYLTAKGYQVLLADNGNTAVEIIKQENPDVVILDGMLPGLDGVDVCKAVRPEFSNAIIMVSARDEEIDEVLGLEMGADEYLIKPIRARALLTRIRKHLEAQALLNSPSEDPALTNINSTQLRFNDLIIDRQAMVVSFNDKKLKISSHEFEVLWLLAENAGKIVTREELVRQIRGFEYDGFDRTIDLRISRLRKKLNDDPTNPYLIKTIRGKGYLFAQNAW